MKHIFISYSRADSTIAQFIRVRLEQKGYKVFSDTQHIVAGQDFSEHVYQELNEADAVIVVLSKNIDRSTWVKQELENALEQKKTIIPLLVGSDATENWIWPLISDRQAIYFQEGDSFRAAREIEKAIKNQLRATKTRLVKSITIIIGFFFGAITALVVEYFSEIVSLIYMFF